MNNKEINNILDFAGLTNVHFYKLNLIYNISSENV